MKYTCAASGTEFEVTEFDLAFYERMGVPVPTLCPDERMRRRTAHRNERHLFRSKSAKSGKNLIGLYRPEANVLVYTQEEWWSDDWDAMESGQDFDFTQPFFDQFHVLSVSTPRTNVVTVQNENSDYTSGTGYCRNCYLINSSEYCEDCMYGKLLQNSSDVYDSAYIYDSQLIYEGFQLENCYDCKWVYYSQNAAECFFCDNVRSCQNCFLCTNLVGKQYHFMNNPLTKEEYEKRVEQVLSTPEHLEKAHELFAEMRKERVYKYANIMNSEACSGDFISNAKACTDCYDINKGEDCKHVQVGVGVKDLMDCSNHYVKSELCYETLGTINTYSCNFCLYVFDSSDLWYCELCFGCTDCFGCVGLRKKKYCIFNKQYTKEEYYALKDKIIAHMKEMREWGEFFPAAHSPFPYADTLAQEYFPLTNSEAPWFSLARRR